MAINSGNANTFAFDFASAAVVKLKRNVEARCLGMYVATMGEYYLLVNDGAKAKN